MLLTTTAVQPFTVPSELSRNFWSAIAKCKGTDELSNLLSLMKVLREAGRYLEKLLNQARLPALEDLFQLGSATNTRAVELLFRPEIPPFIREFFFLFMQIKRYLPVSSEPAAKAFQRKLLDLIDRYKFMLLFEATLTDEAFEDCFATVVRADHLPLSTSFLKVHSTAFRQISRALSHIIQSSSLLDLISKYVGIVDENTLYCRVWYAIRRVDKPLRTYKAKGKTLTFVHAKDETPITLILEYVGGDWVWSRETDDRRLLLTKMANLAADYKHGKIAGRIASYGGQIAGLETLQFPRGSENVTDALLAAPESEVPNKFEVALKYIFQMPPCDPSAVMKPKEDGTTFFMVLAKNRVTATVINASGRSSIEDVTKTIVLGIWKLIKKDLGYLLATNRDDLDAFISAVMSGMTENAKLFGQLEFDKLNFDFVLQEITALFRHFFPKQKMALTKGAAAFVAMLSRDPDLQVFSIADNLKTALGENLNRVDQNGNSWLHWLATKEYFDALPFGVKVDGINLKQKNSHGRTVAQKIMENGHYRNSPQLPAYLAARQKPGMSVFDVGAEMLIEFYLDRDPESMGILLVLFAGLQVTDTDKFVAYVDSQLENLAASNVLAADLPETLEHKSIGPISSDEKATSSEGSTVSLEQKKEENLKRILSVQNEKGENVVSSCMARGVQLTVISFLCRKVPALFKGVTLKFFNHRQHFENEINRGLIRTLVTTLPPYLIDDPKEECPAFQSALKNAASDEQLINRVSHQIRAAEDELILGRAALINVSFERAAMILVKIDVSGWSELALMCVDDEKEIDESALKQAEKEERPTLIWIKNKNECRVYGDPKGDGNWSSTKITTVIPHLEKLPFKEKILKCDDIRFTGSLIDALKPGHAHRGIPCDSWIFGSVGCENQTFFHLETVLRSTLLLGKLKAFYGNRSILEALKRERKSDKRTPLDVALGESTLFFNLANVLFDFVRHNDKFDETIELFLLRGLTKFSTFENCESLAARIREKPGCCESLVNRALKEKRNFSNALLKFLSAEAKKNMETTLQLIASFPPDAPDPKHDEPTKVASAQRTVTSRLLEASPSVATYVHVCLPDGRVAIGVVDPASPVRYAYVPVNEAKETEDKVAELSFPVAKLSFPSVNPLSRDQKEEPTSYITSDPISALFHSACQAVAEGKLDVGINNFLEAYKQVKALDHENNRERVILRNKFLAAIRQHPKLDDVQFELFMDRLFTAGLELIRGLEYCLRANEKLNKGEHDSAIVCFSKIVAWTEAIQSSNFRDHSAAWNSIITFLNLAVKCLPTVNFFTLLPREIQEFLIPYLDFTPASEKSVTASTSNSVTVSPSSGSHTTMLHALTSTHAQSTNSQSPADSATALSTRDVLPGIAAVLTSSSTSASQPLSPSSASNDEVNAKTDSKAAAPPPP